jgi:ABC-type uncharacterized transport system permease subunit
MQSLLIMVSLIGYLLGAGFQALRLSGRLSTYYPIILMLTVLAFSAHGFLLYVWIDRTTGQNLSILNLFSFSLWLLVLFASFMSIRRPVENLFIFIFPFAALSIGLVRLFPEYHVLNMAGETRQLIHILSAISAFAVVCAAALQALLLATQNYLLRHQHVGHLMSGLPPLEVMERLLFQIIWVGFFLLTWVLLSSLYAFDHLLLPPLLQKMMLTFASWSVFAVLLCGRHFLGWRGKKIIYGTLMGFFLLIGIYLGSQFVTHFIGRLS